MRQAAGKQAAEGCHTHKGHRVIAHDAAPLVFGHQRLHDGVAGRQTGHHAVTNGQHQQQTQPQDMRQAEADKAQTKDGRSDLDGAREPNHASTQRQSQRRPERADARRAGEPTQCVRTAVQHLTGKNG